MTTTISNPYTELSGGTWLRGNLHTHPRPQDQPDHTCQRFAEFGYGFLALTEHDHTFTRTEISNWNNCGLILLPGNEVSKNGQHILHVGANHHINPHEDRQKVIDEINADGGFAIINHPNGGKNFGYDTLETMRQLQNYIGLEIFNAGVVRSAGNPYATDKWDILLSAGRKLWGFASDDFHQPSDAARGWLMAYVKDRSEEGVMDALRSGRFYASTGVEIEDIAVGERHIRVQTANAQRLLAICDYGRALAQIDGRTLEVHVPEDASYVRFECWGAGGRQAWTQPFICLY